MKNFKIANVKNKFKNVDNVIKYLIIFSNNLKIIIYSDHAKHVIVFHNLLKFTKKQIRKKLATIKIVVNNLLNKTKNVRIVCFIFLNFFIVKLSFEILKLTKAENEKILNDVVNKTTFINVDEKLSFVKALLILFLKLFDDYYCCCTICDFEIITILADEVKNLI